MIFRAETSQIYSHEIYITYCKKLMIYNELLKLHFT